MVEEEEKKKATWHSPESCNLYAEDREACILEKINELSTLREDEEIVVVGDFHQSRKDGLGNRIGIMKRIGETAGGKYSTHLLSYEEDGTIATFYGHYDLTFEEAVKDLKKREEKERGDLFGYIKELHKQRKKR